jgi:hypothetical protein
MSVSGAGSQRQNMHDKLCRNGAAYGNRPTGDFRTRASRLHARFDDGDRQVLDLQHDALLAAGVDERHLFEDRASGSRGDRTGLEGLGLRRRTR